MALNKLALAEQYCKHYHAGETRKSSTRPFSTHPIAVAKILANYGYDDTVTQCIALLHDTVEDTSARIQDIQNVFGYEISNGVYILSRNKGKEGEKLTAEEYKTRLSFARRKIKRVKLADMIHNTQTLEALTQAGIERKLKDSEEFYIPMGLDTARVMIQELIQNIAIYKDSRKE